jgi:hypothetical protein
MKTGDPVLIQKKETLWTEATVVEPGDYVTKIEYKNGRQEHVMTDFIKLKKD